MVDASFLFTILYYLLQQTLTHRLTQASWVYNNNPYQKVVVNLNLKNTQTGQAGHIGRPLSVATIPINSFSLGRQLGAAILTTVPAYQFLVVSYHK